MVQKLFFIQKSKGALTLGGTSRLEAAKKLHSEVCSLLLASLASLQNTLKEFSDLTSTISHNNANSYIQKSGNFQNCESTSKECHKRFFERDEMKKVFL